MSDTFDRWLDIIKVPVLKTSMTIINLSYVLVFLGIFAINPIYVNYLNIFVQFFICSFLIYRFHPLRKHEYRSSDSSIIFSSALIILTNLIATQFTKYYLAGKNEVNKIAKKSVGYASKMNEDIHNINLKQ